MTPTNRTGSRVRRLAGQSLMIGLATAAFAGIGAGTALAGDPEFENTVPTRDTWWGVHYWAEKESTGSEYSFVAFRETVKPWDSINIPSFRCMSNALEDKNFSPGRIVPNGIEVVEPGGIGVTITKAYGNGVYNTGIDSEQGQSSATNWDPFTSRELVIVVHCTKDPTKAAKQSGALPTNQEVNAVASMVTGFGGY